VEHRSGYDEEDGAALNLFHTKQCESIMALPPEIVPTLAQAQGMSPSWRHPKPRSTAKGLLNASQFRSKTIVT
jgi:hypothetical protein